MSSDDRRAETRDKIQLGGLIVKAGLGAAPKALILGILLEGIAAAADPARRDSLTAIGHRVLVGLA